MLIFSRCASRSSLFGCLLPLSWSRERLDGIHVGNMVPHSVRLAGSMKSYDMCAPRGRQNMS